MEKKGLLYHCNECGYEWLQTDPFKVGQEHCASAFCHSANVTKTRRITSQLTIGRKRGR